MIKLTNILKEIKIEKFKAPKDLLNQMLDSDDFGGESSYFDQFTIYDTFDEWYEDNDRHDENSEIVTLAKTFYKWRDNKDIITFVIEDSEDIDIIQLSKTYKKLITYGRGYNDVRIILSTF